ncbi:MAG: hypothetical protein WA843_03190, partial [Candidatus Saccharimonadales bacterium]
SQDSASANRSSSLLRSAGAKNIGETRVVILQRKYLRGVLEDLANIGIEFQTNSLGGLRSTTIDTEKLAEKYPELKGMSPDEQRSWVADEFDDISADQISFRGGKFFIEGAGMPFKSIELLKSNSLSLLGDGLVSSALKDRVLAQYLDIPSLFSPLKRAAASRLHGALNDNELQAEEEQRVASLTQPVEAQGEAARSNIEDESNKYNSPVMKTLLFTGGACFVRSVAGDVTTINRDRIVLPAVIRVVDLVAIAGRIRSGQNVSLEQVGTVEKGLVNSTGGTVWQGKALQATEGLPSPSGPDLSEDYKQAFSSKTTAGTIKGWADKSLGGSFTAGAACSKAGQFLQIAVTLVGSAASAFAEVGSGAALTPGIVALWAEKESESFAVSAVAMHFIQQFVLNKTTAAGLAKDAFSGPEGGDLLAYGAREAANISAAASGGVALGSQDSALLDKQQQIADQQQFRSESLFARMFDVNDYRSLTGRLADMASPSLSQNVASLAHGFINIGSLFPRVFSTFIPKTQADTTYDWGFPKIGIPSKVLNNPDLQNSAENSNAVATLLDGSSGQDYTNRAKACFGVDINKDSGVWDVVLAGPINPTDDSYINADCDNLGDENWQRIILFDFDTLQMKTIACWQGDDQSCQDIGYGSANSSGSTTPSDDSGNLPTGNVQELAQQIVDLHNQGKITYAVDTSQLDSNFKLIASGKNPVTANGHQPDPDPRILGAIIYLAQQGTVQLNSYVDGQSHTSPGNPHYEGKAIDIGAFEGKTLGSGDVAETQKVENIVSQVLPAHARFGADFYTDPNWQSPITLNGKVFYTGQDAGGHLHMDVLNVD